MDYTDPGDAGTPGFGTGSQPRIDGAFNVDLNDNLFTPGDTLCYFYSATSPDGTNYYSSEFGTTTDINAVASNPMEFTILPAGGYHRGGEWLYVDGVDGTGYQPYWDGAFMVLGASYRVDRYDVRGAASGAGNRLAGRVTNVAAQLSAAYRAILWDCGALSTTLGDGTGDPEKTDDYALLNTFLGNLGPNHGGVYLSGDDVAEVLNEQSGASAATFRSTYLPFVLINGNHRIAPTSLRISPTLVHWPGRAYSDDFFVFGGCPELNDFDVLGASGTTQVQMSYATAQSANGAVIAHTQGNATVVLSGFSLANVRDDELDGILDRAKFFRDTLMYMGFIFSSLSVVSPPPSVTLAQNYPNPFNPATTIRFSVVSKGHVSLAVYDVGGRLVRTLANEVRASGPHEVKWDSRNDEGVPVASGVYFYRLVTPGFTQTKKMVLLK
jgi:hypothetical protein